MTNRIGLAEAFNRSKIISHTKGNSLMESKTIDEKKTANYSALERERNALKFENSKLRCELDEMRSMIKQITCENSHEKFDERRINLLKFQIIQLERQVAVLIEALGARQESVYEVENVMVWLGNKLRSLTANSLRGSVGLEINDLKQMIENVESSRIKLFKSLERSTKESTGKDLLLLNPFLGGKYKQGESLSLLDLSLQRMEYVNMRHVGLLESKMSKLYKELILTEEALQTYCIHGINVNKAEKLRLETVILKTSVDIKNVADDLLSLSILCPSAPWGDLKKPICKEVPIERVKAALPALPRNKQEEVYHVIEACIKTCNHRHLLLQKKNEVLKEELSFHRSVYDLQTHYTEEIIDAVRTGYREFETSIQSVMNNIMRKLLESYSKLKKTATDESLKEFLVIFKENENQLASFVDMLSTQDLNKKENGSSLLSNYGETFLGSINTLVYQCQQRRDKAINEMKLVQDQQRQLDQELQRDIEELETKYEKQWVHNRVKKENNVDINCECSQSSFRKPSAKQDDSERDIMCDNSVNRIQKCEVEKNHSISILNSNETGKLSFSPNKDTLGSFNTNTIDHLSRKHTSEGAKNTESSKESELFPFSFQRDNSKILPQKKSKSQAINTPLPSVAKRSLKLHRPNSLLSNESYKTKKGLSIDTGTS
ncbi:hypothetical protein Btru_056305 [Bulinus truncatus]|nr:hypothetical protein Btru_056305 [Bulinus truncatus]